MTIDPAEQADLDKMKSAILEEKLSCFDLMTEFARMDATSLSHCGHRNGLAAALESTLKSSLSRIKKLNDAHIHKYPD